MENKNEPLLKDEEEKIFMGVDTSSSNKENVESKEPKEETPVLVRKNETEDSANDVDHVIPGVLISKREASKAEVTEETQPSDNANVAVEDTSASKEQPIISEIPITPIMSEDIVTDNSEVKETSVEPTIETKLEDTPEDPEVPNEIVADVSTPTEPTTAEEPTSNEPEKEDASGNSENVHTPVNVYTAVNVNPVIAEPVIVSEPKEVNSTSTEKKKKDPKKFVTIVVTLVLALITVYLLVQTCMGFYYGFKYKNYVTTQNQTTESTEQTE